MSDATDALEIIVFALIAAGLIIAGMAVVLREPESTMSAWWAWGPAIILTAVADLMLASVTTNVVLAVVLIAGLAAVNAGAAYVAGWKPATRTDPIPGLPEPQTPARQQQPAPTGRPLSAVERELEQRQAIDHGADLDPPLIEVRTVHHTVQIDHVWDVQHNHRLGDVTGDPGAVTDENHPRHVSGPRRELGPG